MKTNYFLKFAGILSIVPVIYAFSGTLNLKGKNASKVAIEKIKEPKQKQLQNQENIEVVITYSNPISEYTTNKAPLKYNKAFAYSLTLDDGFDDAYTHAYPLLNGGTLEETGTNYPGLFYTDGCGNDIAFRLGIAWNSQNQDNKDVRSGTPNYITWDQMQELYDAGWDILDHSLTHSAGPGTDYPREVTENRQIVLDKMGVNMTHFVVPTGDTEYIPYAENAGFYGIYNQSGLDGDMGIEVSSPLETSLSPLKLNRVLIEDDQHNTNNVSDNIDHIAQISSEAPHWYNDFTHKVGHEQTGSSLLFTTFEHYMQHIEQNYGKSGADNIWAGSLQEVYEYLYIRENANMSATASENQLIIHIDMSSIPDDFRWQDLSLLVSADAEIEDITVSGAKSYTYTTGQDPDLINISREGGVTSTGHPKKTVQAEIYPNPVDQYLNLSFNNPKQGEVELSLVSATGSIAHSEKIKVPAGSYNKQLNLSELNTGMYSLILKEGNKHQKVFKIIKE
ncbi:T9SS type A sorting domain-containing protein [Cytophagaceae bacterium ABcell3]|nr:T9SS type A sorting domain-containing protein [Cytophagaceae bacterium ABcell3]